MRPGTYDAIVRRIGLFLCVIFSSISSFVLAQNPLLPQAWVDVMQWRTIGPANMGGRITALAVSHQDPSVWWAASASGGLLKTTNNGASFEHQFDRESTVSLGDVQVAPSDHNIVWVGTGESNPRNSVSWGNGVYKSTDGGKTWKNMGLNKTFQIGRMAIHSKDPNIVYVGALGRLWGPNKERGLYKTTDGGKTWKQVLFVDDKTGVIELQMHPADPDILLVATYERQRDGFDGNDPMKKYGPGAGIYRTTDGGATFKKITKGLPSGDLGRIGLSFFLKDPNHVYAVIESEDIGKLHDDFPYAGIQGTDAEAGAKITSVVKKGPAEQAGMKNGDIVIAINDGPIYAYSDLIESIRKHKAGDEVTWRIVRDHKGVELKLKYAKHEQAGKREGSPYSTRLGGQQPNLQTQQGSDGFETGGIFHSSDAGASWKRINSLNPRPMYFSQIRVDPQDRNHLWVLGIPLFHSADGGKTFTSDGAGSGVHVDHHSFWIDPKDGRHIILGNDGGIYVTYDRGKTWDHHNHAVISQFYHVGVGPRRAYRVYGGLQDNGSWGGPSVARHGSGPSNFDWFRVGGGDGFVCLVDPDDPDQLYIESQNGAMSRYHLKTGERGSARARPPKDLKYRFNWKTPFILSNHNSQIHYSAGNYVFRSLNKGRSIKRISPEISRTEKGAGSAISESPLDEYVLYAGTTDGALWCTKDGGQTWIRLDATESENEDPAEEAKEEQDKTSCEDETEEANGSAIIAEQLQLWWANASADQPPRDKLSRLALRTLLKKRDKNGDGQLQKSEWPARLARVLTRADSNGDSVLQESELEQLLKSLPPGTETTQPEKPPMPAEEPKTEESKTGKPKTEETQTKPKDPQTAHPLSGKWEGDLISDNLPKERRGFQLVIRRNADETLTGTYRSARGEAKVLEVSFDAAKSDFTVVVATRSERRRRFKGKAIDGQLNGNMTIESAGVSFPFIANRTGPPPAKTPSKDPAETKSPEPAGDSLAKLLPGPRWVSSITASRFKPGRVYVTFDGHRSDDDATYPLVSADFGKSWRSLKSNLPDSAGSARVLREDRVNENVLYLGCEFGCWVSINLGQSWTRLNSNLPTVAVHEFAQHISAGEMVAGTHGRGIWVLDVTTLRQLSPESLKADAVLYRPNVVIQWRRDPSRGNSGGPRSYVGQNPPRGASIHYSLGKAANSVQLVITDLRGNQLAELTTQNKPGLHRTSWDLRVESQRGGRRSRGASPGTYLVKLTVDGKSFEQELRIEEDPGEE